MDSFEINQVDDRVTFNGDETIPDEAKADRIKKNLDKYQKLFGIDEDTSDQPTTTRKELWSYYLFCNVSASPLFEDRELRVLTINT